MVEFHKGGPEDLEGEWHGADHDLPNVRLVDLGHEPGRTIRVKYTSLDTKQLPASDQFIAEIEFLKPY